ncbi:putative DNA modification/repair radical SAM protein [Desulfonatronum thioautotrophicum]|uniref:putative DNA modification/repair radical SAM protein n=1 Tax=Desulfonatronum thioautotrophicum TaxID=617001 RepID=UPI000A01298A|nr:putative DNA modification/repair radical SAM protein [Desulfonatronum thioautotrophicum]
MNDGHHHGVPAVIHQPDMTRKVAILAESARYDVSCSSSGSRAMRPGGVLGAPAHSGICHSWSADGRCISLLKILYTNVCEYNCAYCINRSDNDLQRTTFTVGQLVDLTLNFYRRNYIEGLFLSSAVCRNPDWTMERMVLVVEQLRRVHGFGGYIHLKVIPGSAPELLERAGLAADRLSVNIELPSEVSLRSLAPQKTREGVLLPMLRISERIGEAADNRRRLPARTAKGPQFAPAGQSTQLIVGASPEPDRQILRLAEALYGRFGLKRVYYSGYVPVSQDNRLPALNAPPLLREHRLYQADWLLRFYGFQSAELFDDQHEWLDDQIDPKAAWALRQPDLFPVEVNRASLEKLLRIPGIGLRSARRIITARRFGPLHPEDLKKFGVVMKRACYFVTASGKFWNGANWDPAHAERMLRGLERRRTPRMKQLSLWGDEETR